MLLMKGTYTPLTRRAGSWRDGGSGRGNDDHQSALGPLPQQGLLVQPPVHNLNVKVCSQEISFKQGPSIAWDIKNTHVSFVLGR